MNLIPFCIHESTLSLIFSVHSGNKFQPHFTTEGIHHFLLGFTGDLLDCPPFRSQQK